MIVSLHFYRIIYRNWYYLNQSGEMIVDTVVDGYVLSSNGQLIY